MEDKKYSKLKASFEATQPQIPADFTERVMKRVGQPAPARGRNEVARHCGLDPTEIRRARRLPVSLIAAAACVALLFYVGGVRNTQHSETTDIVAQTDTAKTMPQTETKKELPIEKGETADTVKRVKEILRMSRPPKHYMAKAEMAESTPEPELIDEVELAERAFAEERIRMEMEMTAQTSGSLQAEFKGLTDEIRRRGERMSQHVEMALNEDE